MDSNDFYDRLVKADPADMVGFVGQFCDTSRYSRRDYLKAHRVLLQVRANEVNRRMFHSLTPRIRSGEVAITYHDGCGGSCVCGKTGLKESTVLKSNTPIEIMDYRGVCHKGTAFNLGNECIQTFKLMIYTETRG